MKPLKIVLATTVCYAAMIAHAHADPISLTLGNAIFAALYSIGLPGVVANFIAVNGLTLALAGGAIVSSFARRPKAGAVNPTEAKSNFESGESSIMEGVGYVRVGGLKNFGNTDGSTRARVISRLHGRIDAIESRFLGGREVTVEPNGDVSSPPWTRPGGSWCKWLDKLGDKVDTAWPDLVSLFPSLWTSAHILPEIAHSMLLFYNPGLSAPKFLSLYQNGAPESEWVARASRVYDPFNEECLVDDEETWGWTENGILILPHILRRDPAFASDRFNWTLITLEAVKAAANVATLTGTEQRSRLGGIWAWESERGATMQQFLDSAGAIMRLDENGKIWFQLIDDAPEAEIDFTPADQYQLDWKAGPEAIERPNICRIKYYSHERNYELAEITLLEFDDDGLNIGAPWAYVADEVDRYGPKYLDIELPFCPSVSQAQRIGRRVFDLARAEAGVMKNHQVGLAAWGLHYATVELPDLGDVLLARIEAPRDGDSGEVEVPFTVWPQLPAWNPETDEMPGPDLVPEMGYETDMTTPNSPTTAIQVTYPSGGAKEMRMGYALPAQPYNLVEANYRSYTGGLPNAWQSMTEIGGTVAYAAVDLIGQAIDARVRVFNGDDGTLFSPPANLTVVLNNTACGAPGQTATGPDGAVDPVAKTLDVTVASNDIQVAALRLRFNGATVSTINARPYQQVRFTAGPAVASGTWSVVALTTDGTVGAPLNYPVTV